MSELIYRQAAIDAAKDWYEGLICGSVNGLIKRLNALPTIQPERAEGEWSDGYRWQRCSLCKQTGKKSWNYCPNCGAKMTISTK